MRQWAKIPGSERAVVDPAKIAGYLLNPTHRTGRHKARVFAAALSLRAENHFELVAALLDAAKDREAEPDIVDDFGARYVIEFDMNNSGQSALIRSSWIVRSGEDFPRFVTAYVVKQETEDE